MYQWETIAYSLRNAKPTEFTLNPQSFVEHDSKRASTAYLREYLYGMQSAGRNFDGELLILDVKPENAQNATLQFESGHCAKCLKPLITQNPYINGRQSNRLFAT